MKEELFEWILHQGFADRELIAMWRKPGSERLCCVGCSSEKDPDSGCPCLMVDGCGAASARVTAAGHMTRTTAEFLIPSLRSMTFKSDCFKTDNE
jgi:hypothetical protein